MRDVLPAIDRWASEGKRFAIAVVVSTSGSFPRPLGSAMAVCEDGQVSGSVSGGCVESSVIEAALSCISNATPSAHRFEAASPEDVWRIGLTCGGEIEVWVFPGWTIDWPDRARWESAADEVRSQRPYSLNLREPLGERIFEWILNPPHRLVVIGGVHIAIPLIAMAKELGFETILVEPRALLAGSDRFTIQPDLVLTEWPDAALAGLGLDRRTFVVALTHDPKLDDPALATALASNVAYIGALGNRRSHEQRCARLAEAGFTGEAIARIRGPVGLSIGAKTSAEIAVSILAEIVQVRNEA